MINEYHQQVTMLVNRSKPRLSSKRNLEFKPCFGAIAGYLDGNIFITCGKFGLALRLSQKKLDELFSAGVAKPLKYFEKGHIKKEYGVLSEELINNDQYFNKIVNASIKYVDSLNKILG